MSKDMEEIIARAKLDLTLAVGSATSITLTAEAEEVQANLLEVTAVAAIRLHGELHWRATRAYTIRRAVAIHRLAEVLATANQHRQIEKADLCDAADMIIKWARENDGCSEKPELRFNCFGYKGRDSIGCEEN